MIENTVAMRVIVVCAAMVAPIGLAAQDHHGAADAHWSYVGAEGPTHWGNLSPAYGQCGTGSLQSPIDIPRHVASSTAAIEFHYRSTPLELINNGHTIQANYAPGSYILLDDERFELLQFHFHGLSEHTVGGRPFAMEAHFVHQSASGHLAVVGVFLKQGATNPFLGSLWDHLPQEANQKEAPTGVSINGADLLPEDRSLIQYSGSLTTPPCSEGVFWNLLQTPVEVSEGQVASFTAIFRSNARPVQPLNGRVFNQVKPGAR